MLQQFVPTAVTAPVPPPRSECRVYERYACSVPTSCKPAAANEMKWEATIRNISRAGLSLCLPRRFERGAGLAIELPEKDGSEWYVVFVKVIHTRSMGDGSWALGCKFISELSEEELERLLAAFGLDTSKAAQKQPMTDVQLHIDLPNGTSIRRRIQRFLVATAWPYPAGHSLTLRFKGADGTRTPYAFEVVRCERQGAAWSLQVRLADPSAAPELLRAIRR